MRIEIRSARGESFVIDSLDPELLARWLLETVARIKPNPAEYAVIQAWPSVGLDGKPDWITDNRVLGRLHFGTTARDLLAALESDLADAERLS